MANIYNSEILPNSKAEGEGAPKNAKMRHNSDMAYQLFDINETSKKLGVSRSMIYNLINKKALRAVKQGNRTFVRGLDIIAYIDALPTYEGGIYEF